MLETLAKSRDLRSSGHMGFVYRDEQTPSDPLVHSGDTRQQSIQISLGRCVRNWWHGLQSRTHAQNVDA